MKWKEEYACGIARIDEQHRSIFKATEDFQAALDEGGGERTYGIFLEFLNGYTRGHFSYEEGCMDRHQCPFAQKNKSEHALMLTMIQDFLQRYEDHGYRPEDARELLTTVDTWLDQHICQIDVHLKECVGHD